MDDPLERIKHASRAYLEFFDLHPEYVELLIQERAQFRDRATPTYFEHRKKNVARWRELYRSLIGEGADSGTYRFIASPNVMAFCLLRVHLILNYFGGETETFLR